MFGNGNQSPPAGGFFAAQNPFAGFAQSEPGTPKDYIQAGEHVFQIEQCRYQLSKNQKAGKAGQPQVIVTLITRQSTVHPVGMKRSVVFNLSQARSLGEYKVFVLSAMKVTNEQVKQMVAAGRGAEVDQLGISACDPAQQLCAGRLVHCSAVDSPFKSKETGQMVPFVRNTFNGFDEATGQIFVI